jgi:FkbM family methyltransferase
MSTCYLLGLQETLGKFLRRTMESSHFKNRWELIEKCAGAKAGTTEFTLSQEISAEFDGMHHTKRVSSRRTCRVPVTTVDEEWKRRNCPEVSIIKCDVEGAEMEVLYGAVECINRARPYIMMEWNRINIKAYDVTFVNLGIH